MTFKIRKLSYALGAEISGIDISLPLDDKTFSEVHSAFLEHNVVVFRGQSALTREQHIAFSRQFGEIDTTGTTGKRVGREENRSAAGIGDGEYREILVNRYEPNSKRSDHGGEYWHSDRSDRPIPASASILRAVEIPEIGGDTMFANMYRAYESLSEGMKKLIEGLYIVHLGGLNTKPRVTAQPLVRTHPETGRKSLFLGLHEPYNLIVGMTAEESKPLIRFLLDHATRPQFCYRHIWQRDDLLMWDNRCLMHCALGDYDDSRLRHMERTTLIGSPVGGYTYEGPL